MNKSRVKFGKISAVLRQNGFFAGLKIISVKLLQVVSGMLTKPKGDVIFISGLTGAVAMYRTYNIAEELNKHKFKTSVLYEGDPFLIGKAKRARVIILNRVTWSNKIQKLLKQAEYLKQDIIYDTDDLTFDIKKFKQSEAYENFNDVQKEQYEKTTGLEILQSKQLKAITTTTTFLAEKLMIFKKPVYVVKNKLSEQDLKFAVKARKNYLSRIQGDNKEIRLGYFSGSSSHNKDFNVIISALEVILDKYENVRLYTVGYLDVQSKFYKKFKKQVVQLPFVQSRKKHYKNIAQIDINLAPLEMNDFCQVKSELKFFEAGIVGVPTVAVSNQTFSEVITDGKDGLLAGTTSEWIDKLESLIKDRELRVRLGKNARQTVMKKHLITSGGSEEYYKFLRSFLKR